MNCLRCKNYTRFRNQTQISRRAFPGDHPPWPLGFDRRRRVWA